MTKKSMLPSLLLIVLSAGAVSTQTLDNAPTQPFNRHLLPATTTVGAKDGVATDSATNGAPANATIILTPNDPGFDVVKADLINLRLMLGELNQRMAQGEKASWREVGIAILDGGPRLSATGKVHPDLDNIWIQFDMDFIGGQVTSLHGTAVHSVAAAITNNGQGAASPGGFTGTIHVVHIRIFDNDGSVGDELKAIDAVTDLVVNQRVPIRFVNASFGGDGRSSLEEKAFKRLTDAGVIVFAGLGKPSPGQEFCPACYADKNPSIVPVTATTTAGDAVDPNAGTGNALAAPTNIRAVADPDNPDAVGGFGGVSATVPQVTGVAAVAASVHPNDSPLDTVHRLQMCGTGTIVGATFGRLNAFCPTTAQVSFVEDSTGGATAIDAVNNIAGPFTVRTAYIAVAGLQEMPTRVGLFLYNLPDGISPNEITVTGTTAQNTVIAFTTEAAVKIPGYPFLTQVNIILPATAQGAGKVSLNLVCRGQAASNTPTITIQ